VSGLSLRHVADRAGLSAGHLSKILNGSRLPSTEQLRVVLYALGAADADKQQLVTLHERALAERDAPTPTSPPRTNAAAVQDGRLSVLLSGLKDESGLSVREIADRMASQGIDAGKSSIDRALRYPSQSPQLSFHTAEVLIEELPPEQRGPVRTALFQATGRGRMPVSWPVQLGVMPHRPAGFQRRAEADRLTQVLGDTEVGSGRTVVLSGMGGVGKTQLAADYARNVWATGNLDLMVWVRASSHAAVTAAYAQAAADLLGSDPADSAASVVEFLAWLEPKQERRPCRWLIVLDDVAQPDDLRALWPPNSPHGRTLVTTRRRDAALAGQDRRLIEVGLFTQEESVAYLTAALANYDRYEPTDELVELAEELGNLPLALSQAAAYLIDSGLSAAAYRQLLADRPVPLSDVAPDVLPDDQHSSMATSWSLSIERANALRPHGLAGPLLRLAAFLDTVIPAVVFTTQPALDFLARDRSVRPQHERTSPAAVEQADAQAAVRALHRLSLVHHAADLPNSPVRVHRLIQRTVRDSLPAPDYAEVARAAADALAAAWPETESGTAFEDALRPSVFALAGYAGDELLHPTVHTVLFRAGRSLGHSGHVVEALAYFTDLADHIAAHLGLDHPDALAARFEAARWKGEAGYWAEARPMLSNLLSDQIRVLGDDHPDTLATRHELARSHGETGRPYGAIEELSKLLAHAVRVLGDDHPDTIRARRSRAHWLGETGNSAAAVADLSDLLPRMTRLLGPEHPDLFITRLLHGHWVGEAGEPDQAVDLLSPLVREMVRVLGGDHPDTLTAHGELARWMGKSGDPAEAAAILEDVVHRMTRVLGQEHPSTLSARHSLAICQGNARAAFKSGSGLAAFLSRSIRALGSDRPHTLAAHRAGPAG
jgi:tetratricopeptide (TPR) repeat protein